MESTTSTQIGMTMRGRLSGAWACASVSRTAQEIVNEVRRRFIERPGIMTYKEKPNYGRCVSIIVSATLRVMIKPGDLAIISPTIGGDWLNLSLSGQLSFDPRELFFELPSLV
ncbi:hypothetical protein CQW23_03845 [Capsicum baccatum]|uniref:H(+)-exporting diphosphatase n=1 Tax=Capsicum baccatum TaxID=33114 RepID=A0A2G2XD37_CAPBA|nr:hypothetical protein CQW23_03845 [Capsicum baccatum]